MKYRLDKVVSPSDQAEAQNYINPAIAAMQQVGSREIEYEIEELKAHGRKIVEVYGYPVVPPPEHVREAAAAAAASTFFPPSSGLLELREALAAALFAQYGFAPDPEKQILITSGAMHALHVVLMALLGPGDEALLISPCYFFGGPIELARARAVYVSMDESDGYAMDFGKIRAHLSERTRLIVLSSPVNPTGYVYTRSDVEQFVDLAEERDLLLVSDESYDRMLYDGLDHISPLHFPEGRSRTLLVKSFTKSYALPSWRVGYVLAPASLTPYFRKVLEWTMLHGPYINQVAALAALQGPQGWLAEVFREFEKRRNQLIEGIRDLQTLTCIPPKGGPFIFLNHKLNSAAHPARFAGYLLSRYGIPAVAGSYFNAADHVRIPFGGSQEAVSMLVEALEAADESGR